MELASVLTDLMQLNDEEAWILEKIYKNSAIEKRYSVVPDILHPKKRFCSSTRELRSVGMSERNETYKKAAPPLAEKAAKQALQHWSRPPSDITHVISVSCTGVISPGIEYYLARQLELDKSTSLLGINFMGCFGAFKALKVATKIAKDNPKNRILLVCTELCTLHFKPHGDIESIVVQSLFADGSAAIILGAEPNNKETPLFAITGDQSSFIHDTMEDMTWDAGDEGFDMTLTRRVPTLISEHIAHFTKQLAGHAMPYSQYEWAIHPGGKSIVETIEKTMCLDRSQTQSSWNVLQQFGNLSSATILYVLDDIAKRKDSKEEIIGLGFGPGLCIEGLLLKQNIC
jgi:predicted naringenin-chalcone synthase